MEKKWINETLKWACGVLIGILITIGSVVGQTRENTVQINNIKDQQKVLTDQQKSDRESFDKRMQMVVSVIEDSNKTTRDLITVIKMQYNVK